MRTKFLRPIDYPYKTKVCPKCGKRKPATHEYFYPDKDGKICHCIACVLSRQTTWAKDNREKMRARRQKWNFKKRYGITPEEYEKLLAAQNGACAICLQPPSGEGRLSLLHVDHCHTTGVVRGLLCFNCNNALGSMKDSPELLRAGAAYLERKAP